VPRRQYQGDLAWQAGDPGGDLPHRRRSVPQHLGDGGRVAAAQRLQVALDSAVAAGVALLDDLGVQRGGAAHSGLEPLVQVGLERVEFAGPHAAGDKLLDTVDAQVPPNGLDVQSEPAGDHPHRQALHPLSVDLQEPPPVRSAAANQRKKDAVQQLAPLTDALDDIEARIAELVARTKDLELG